MRKRLSGHRLLASVLVSGILVLGTVGGTALLFQVE